MTVLNDRTRLTDLPNNIKNKPHLLMGFQRVDKADTLMQTSKNEVIFCEIVFVGVRGYGRERFRKKQVTARKTQCFLAVFIIILCGSSRTSVPTIYILNIIHLR